MRDELTEAVYCKYKFPCSFKQIIKSRYKKARYYVICNNTEGCNQKTLFPICIELTDKIIYPLQLSRTLRFKHPHKAIVNWEKRLWKNK
jgi:hypothetical protein